MSIFYVFIPYGKKGEARIARKNILNASFLNTGMVNVIRFFRSAKGISVRSLQIYFTVGIRLFGIKNPNLIPLSSCEFHENRARNALVFLGA